MVRAKAIHGQATFEVITEILNRGYTLKGPDGASLISRFSVSELEKLENYGVEYNDSEILGRSISNPERASFDHLLAKNQLAFSNDEDVVKDILDRSSILRLDPYFAGQVFEKGAPDSRLD